MVICYHHLSPSWSLFIVNFFFSKMWGASENDVGASGESFTTEPPPLFWFPFSFKVSMPTSFSQFSKPKISIDGPVEAYYYCYYNYYIEIKITNKERSSNDVSRPIPRIESSRFSWRRNGGRCCIVCNFCLIRFILFDSILFDTLLSTDSLV